MTTVVKVGYQFQLFMPNAAAGFRWRLLSGNNREAGRGMISYRTVDDCVSAIASLQAQEAELVGRVRRTDPNRWLWELSWPDKVVVATGRPADRQVRAEAALLTFRLGVASAEIRPTVVVSDSRRWRSGRS